MCGYNALRATQQQRAVLRFCLLQVLARKFINSIHTDNIHPLQLKATEN